LQLDLPVPWALRLLTSIPSIRLPISPENFALSHDDTTPPLADNQKRAANVKKPGE